MNSEGDYTCDGVCAKNDMIADDDINTEFNFRITYNEFVDDDQY